MFRKSFILLVLGSISFQGCKTSSHENHGTEKPNIIFLLTDDQRWDALGFAGNPVISTPNLDSLAQNGTYFKNAYVTTSICAVSRASILTGQYARRHDIWNFTKSLSEDQLNHTYPLLLQNDGYTIGFIGKYGVGKKQPTEVFDYWRGFPGQGTYKETDKNGNPIHLTKKIEGQALEFLDLQKDNPKPFNLSISFKAPHVEEPRGMPGFLLPDPQYADLHENEVIPVPVASSPAYFDYFPKEFTENNVARKRWKNRFATPEMQQENIKKYYQLIHGVDVAVGKIMEKLRETGMAHNTIIIFMSDNGMYLGEYGFAGKWYGSDPSIRVPMIIYNPLNKDYKGQIIEEKVLNIDIAPTILSLAGIEAPEEMQGRDIDALVSNPDIEWRDSFFYEHLWKSSPRFYIPSTEGVIKGDYKYMTYFLNRDSTEYIFQELYDLRKDPLELNNLVNKNEYRKLQKDLIEELQQQKKQAY